MAKTSRILQEKPRGCGNVANSRLNITKHQKGLAIRVNANKLNKKLGTYGNRDGLDAAHYKGSKTKGRKQKPSINRRINLKLTNDPITTNT